MSTLLAMIFSMSLLGGCAPSHTDPGSTLPVGLHSSATACHTPLQVEETEPTELPGTAPPSRTGAPRRSAPRRRLRRARSIKPWVPERVPVPSYLNNRPHGRR